MSIWKTMLPVLGFGTYKIKDSKKIHELVEAAVKPPGAYKLIDTASVYQNEKFIGEVLNSMILSSIIQREDIFITSKLGPSEQGYDNCISAVKRSLENLQTSYLDLYLIHWPGVSGGVPPSDPKHSQLRKESWKAMEKMYEEGLLKNIGVSNYTVSHLEELLTYATVVPFANQVECHPYLAQCELRNFCKDSNIQIQAYSSLGGTQGKDELLSDEVVKSLASAHGKNAAQILLKWALQHDMSVIPKTENLGRLKENSELFDFTLTEDDMKKLDSLNKNIHYCWDPTSIL